MADEDEDTFRGGHRRVRDRHFGISDKAFWRWWHRQEKDKHGEDDFAARSWCSEGSSMILRFATRPPRSDIHVDIVESGSFEARNQAIFFLQEHRFTVEPGLIEAAMTRLSRLMEPKEEEQAEAAEFAKHYLLDYECRTTEVTA